MDLSWIDIVIPAVCSLIGALFGGGAIYWKENKKGKQIENEGKKVENQHNVVQDYQSLLNWLKEQMKEYKNEVDKKVAEVKVEVAGMRSEISELKRINSEAYRCIYPPTIEDCPVIKAMKQSKKCEECRKKGADDCIDCKEE